MGCNGSWLRDRSAYNRRYIAKKPDIDKVLLGYSRDKYAPVHSSSPQCCLYRRHSRLNGEPTGDLIKLPRSNARTEQIRPATPRLFSLCSLCSACSSRRAFVIWVINACIAMWEAIEQLKKEGRQFDDADVKHLSPARYEHINVFGKYSFPVKEELSRKRLRPLRVAGLEAWEG